MQKAPLHLFHYMEKRRKMSCKNVAAEMRLYLQLMFLQSYNKLLLLEKSLQYFLQYENMERKPVANIECIL